VGGGGDNVAGNEDADPTNATYATVAGGAHGTAAEYGSVVGGGLYNEASGQFATVAGGGPSDLASPMSTNNAATDDYCTVGGGAGNLAGDDYGESTTCPYATVGGGWSNEASAKAATVSGGYMNDVVGTGVYSTISGGRDNAATGEYAVVAGGRLNRANGHYSFAAGRRAQANAAGAYAWADSTDSGFINNVTNRFAVRAIGGVYLYTKSDCSTGAYLATDPRGILCLDQAIVDELRHYHLPADAPDLDVADELL
jgi:hypothetical protein